MLCLACTANENNTATTADSTQTQIVSNAAPASIADDEIQELGLLKEVDDMVYPMVSLTIEFPERKMSEYFTINVESVKGIDIEKLRSWVGRYVSFRYTSNLVNALLDVQHNGTSLLGAYAPDINPEMTKVEGILSGADEETPGDLPGTVTITTNDNNTLMFPFFVTKEMVEVNGKQVVGYYEERPENVVTAIGVADKK